MLREFEQDEDYELDVHSLLGLILSIRNPTQAVKDRHQRLMDSLEEVKKRSDLIVGSFESGEITFLDVTVRCYIQDGEPWLAVTDLADALGYRDAYNISRILDEDEKGYSNLSTLGGDQKILFTNESGMYHIIFKSSRKEAKEFRRWVTSEVLPAIRKTGTYSVVPLMSEYRTLDSVKSGWSFKDIAQDAETDAYSVKRKAIELGWLSMKHNTRTAKGLGFVEEVDLDGDILLRFTADGYTKLIKELK